MGLRQLGKDKEIKGPMFSRSFSVTCLCQYVSVVMYTDDTVLKFTKKQAVLHMLGLKWLILHIDEVKHDTHVYF